MDLSVQNVYGLLLRSKLLSLEDARKMYERWTTEARDAAANPGRFAKWMVANHYVTEYQASLLARGHADCFFLSQYKVLDKLGKGRMAGVFKALHPLGPIVAIKVLPPSKAKEPHTLARFQREARLALRLKHPNVVRTFQVGEALGLHYLVMEHLEGETLDEVLERRGQLPPAEAVRLIHQALLGLQHIHEQGLVHRDLKPANLMLVPGRIPGQADVTLRATVKILDIGMGRALFDEMVSDGVHKTSLTSEETLLGTPDYMAPEQARDARAADIRSDIYSLGCVLYHALTGQPPFPDSNIISQMIRHATEAPRPLKELNPAVPDGLQQIVNWMLAKVPGQRYPTPDRAAQALQVFLAAGVETLPAPEADPRMRSYLTWLETEANGKPPSPPAAIPVGQPVAAGVAPASARPKTPGGKRRSKKNRRRRPPTIVSVAVAPPPTSPPTPPPAPAAIPVAIAQGIDVELVPASVLGKDDGIKRSGLSRRDFLAFGAGAVCVLGAIGLGWMVAQLARKKEPPPEESDRDKKPSE
jgi:serine/threonine protein kinase